MSVDYDEGEEFPDPLTEEAAARFAHVSRRTIREWRASGALVPIARSLEIMGQHYYWPAAVVKAEMANRNGRTRRAATRRPGP